jgi:hypothetical protein
VNTDVSKIIEAISETVRGPLLVSAYDVYNSLSFPHVGFPDLVFLDSGGYECAQDHDVCDIGLYKPEPMDWSIQDHTSVLDAWPRNPPTVAISYDHPGERCSLSRQIECAKGLLMERTQFLHEILLKSEEDRLLDFGEVCSMIDQTDCFDIIGFTEKELGDSVIERMLNIARVRLSLMERGVEKPIHVFGSLDPITTPLYFMSGADIFDGLAWLRFSLSDSGASYIDSVGPKRWGIESNFRDNWARTIVENYNYLVSLRLRMRRFSRTGDFSLFGVNGDFFQAAYEQVKSRIGGVM